VKLIRLTVSKDLTILFGGTYLVAKMTDVTAQPRIGIDEVLLNQLKYLLSDNHVLVRLINGL
jgi:hypothetical protein